MTTAIGAYATAALLKLRTGIPDTTDDVELGKVCDQVNGYIESPAACGRVLAPIASATFLFDGDGTRCLRYPKGIRAVSLLEVAAYTGAAYVTLDSSQFFLRPGPADLMPGWPYTRIELTDYPTSAYGVFPRGYNTVRVTMTTGWAAIPDEITEIALRTATKAWHSIQSGQTNVVGTDAMGAPVINANSFDPRDLKTLMAYSVNIP